MDDANLLLASPNDPLISTNEKHEYCIHVISDKKPFKVTLVWTDYPSSPAAKVNLVNDLDLVVVGPEGRAFLGNGAQSVIGNTRNSPDNVNNVEEVSFDGPAPGYYTVAVHGSNVLKGPQAYALVITGNIVLSDVGDLCIPSVATVSSSCFSISLIALVFVFIALF
jgi:hypothetical protein